MKSKSEVLGIHRVSAWRDQTRITRESCGQAGVEFALTIPVVMVVLFVAVQMALIGQIAPAPGQANYQGARVCLTPSGLRCHQLHRRRNRAKRQHQKLCAVCDVADDQFGEAKHNGYAGGATHIRHFGDRYTDL